MTEQTLLSRKHDLAFSHLDLNGNGEVERDDLIGLGVRLLSQFGENPSSAKGKAVVGTFGDLWEALVAHCDTNGDGHINAQEYHKGMNGAFIEEGGGYERAFLPAVRAVMGLVDVNGDGTLGPDEFRLMQKAFGTPDNEISRAFKALDRDGSGTLTVEELTAAARQFYTGDDESSPGNLLFGAF